MEAAGLIIVLLWILSQKLKEGKKFRKNPSRFLIKSSRRTQKITPKHIIVVGKRRRSLDELGYVSDDPILRMSVRSGLPSRQRACSLGQSRVMSGIRLKLDRNALKAAEERKIFSDPEQFSNDPFESSDSGEDDSETKDLEQHRKELPSKVSLSTPEPKASDDEKSIFSKSRTALQNIKLKRGIFRRVKTESELEFAQSFESTSSAPCSFRRSSQQGSSGSQDSWSSPSESCRTTPIRKLSSCTLSSVTSQTLDEVPEPCSRRTSLETSNEELQETPESSDSNFLEACTSNDTSVLEPLTVTGTGITHPQPQTPEEYTEYLSAIHDRIYGSACSHLRLNKDDSDTESVDSLFLVNDGEKQSKTLKEHIQKVDQILNEKLADVSVLGTDYETQFSDIQEGRRNSVEVKQREIYLSAIQSRARPITRRSLSGTAVNRAKPVVRRSRSATMSFKMPFDRTMEVTPEHPVDDWALPSVNTGGGPGLNAGKNHGNYLYLQVPQSIEEVVSIPSSQESVVRREVVEQDDFRSEFSPDDESSSSVSSHDQSEINSHSRIGAFVGVGDKNIPRTFSSQSLPVHRDIRSKNKEFFRLRSNSESQMGLSSSGSRPLTPLCTPPIDENRIFSWDTAQPCQSLPVDQPNRGFKSMLHSILRKHRHKPEEKISHSYPSLESSDVFYLYSRSCPGSSCSLVGTPSLTMPVCPESPPYFEPISSKKKHRRGRSVSPSCSNANIPQNIWKTSSLRDVEGIATSMKTQQVYRVPSPLGFRQKPYWDSVYQKKTIEPLPKLLEPLSTQDTSLLTTKVNKASPLACSDDELSVHSLAGSQQEIVVVDEKPIQVEPQPPDPKPLETIVLELKPVCAEPVELKPYTPRSPEYLPMVNQTIALPVVSYKSETLCPIEQVFRCAFPPVFKNEITCQIEPIPRETHPREIHLPYRAPDVDEPDYSYLWSDATSESSLEDTTDGCCPAEERYTVSLHMPKLTTPHVSRNKSSELMQALDEGCPTDVSSAKEMRNLTYIQRSHKQSTLPEKQRNKNRIQFYNPRNKHVSKASITFKYETL